MSPKVWEEPTEVTQEDGNALDPSLVTRKSHRVFNEKKWSAKAIIQDAGPTSNNQILGGVVMIGQEIQHLDESNCCKKPGPRVHDGPD